jgi:hypothetical protein
MSPRTLTCFVLLALLVPLSGQVNPRTIPPASGEEQPEDMRLPSGKLQSEEILKADHDKSVEDAKAMVELAQSLQKDLDQKGAKDVLSLADIHKTEEIEKLAKRIRARIRRW